MGSFEPNDAKITEVEYTRLNCKAVAVCCLTRRVSRPSSLVLIVNELASTRCRHKLRSYSTPL